MAVRVVVATVVALVVTPAAAALDCPNTPLEERLAAADAAFVGRVVADREAPGQTTTYRFLVDQRVKGPVGREIEVRSTERLVDAVDKPVVHDEAIGVMANLNGATLVTESCLLTDPGALLSVSDEARGSWIKIAIGLVILALVLAYSIRRLRARQAELRRVGAG